jgi:hypothetical protein
LKNIEIKRKTKDHQNSKSLQNQKKKIKSKIIKC